MARHPKPTDRKKLDCPPDQFIAEIAMHLDMPSWDYLQRYAYTRGGFPMYGPAAWLAGSETGRAFTQCVTRHGDAAARAFYWLRVYYHKVQHGKTKTQRP